MNKNNHRNFPYQKTALLIIIGFTILRCLIAFSMELGTDEAYYWFYSKNLKWNYFDHPPMVAFWIRFFTANLLLQETEGFVRLGSVVGGAVASWAIYKTCATLHSAKSGLIGVCLYNASIYATITAGVFSMPDSPQMVFYTLALWALTLVQKNDKNFSAWMAFGVVAGFCIMSKVYGAFLWTGVGLFALLKKREWFSQPHFYVAILVTALIASPILIWNLQNDFLTYKFHSTRADVTKGSFDAVFFGREVLNQLFYNNPVNVIVTMLALTAFIRGRNINKKANDVLILFNLIALPLALLLLVISIFRDTTLPHWSGPAYIGLIPLAAIYLAKRPAQYAKNFVFSSLSLMGVFLVVWQYLIHLAPSVIYEVGSSNKSLTGERSTMARLLSGFESFQLIAATQNSWEPAADAFIKFYQGERGGTNKNIPVVCNKWWGAQIEYYFCQSANIPVIGLGKANELHEYLFTNAKREKGIDFSTAYCIVPTNDSYNVQVNYSSYYRTIDSLFLISVKRNGRPLHTFSVYKLRGWKARLPMIEEK